VVAASAAFGLIHWWGGPATIFMSFLIGLAFSVLYLRRGTLTACIAAHFVLDLPLFLFMLFPAPLPVQSHLQLDIRAQPAQYQAAAPESRGIPARGEGELTMKTIGIAAHSAEGAGLCFLTACRVGGDGSHPGPCRGGVLHLSG
jgi:hypothetical protein